MTEFTKDVYKQLATDERNKSSAISWLRFKLKTACEIIDGQEEEIAKLKVKIRSKVDAAIWVDMKRQEAYAMNAQLRAELKAKDEAMMQAQYLLMIYNANRFPIPTRLGDYENHTELITDCRRRLSEALKGKG